MPYVSREVLAQATQHFANNPLGPDEQTLIALFLQSLKTANAGVLSKVEVSQIPWLPYRFLHEQCYKEIELSTLLGKAVAWSSNPMIYGNAMLLNANFLQRSSIAQYIMGIFPSQQIFYEYLALSHAMMSQVRFMPLLPATVSLEDPFYHAINEIEVENGRMIQTQIRLLKDMEVPLTLTEREHVIDKQCHIIGSLFTDVLTMLCQIKPE